MAYFTRKTSLAQASGTLLAAKASPRITTSVRQIGFLGINVLHAATHVDVSICRLFTAEAVEVAVMVVMASANEPTETMTEM